MMIENHLIHSPEHYRERLSAYAAYTMDIATPVGTFTQKANREDNITVVDEGDGYYRIYLAYYPKIKIRNFNSGGLPEPVNDYFAKIRIDHEVRMNIYPVQRIDLPISRTNSIVPMPAILFLGATSQDDNTVPMLLFGLIGLGVIVALRQWIERTNREHFRRLLVEFLNRV